ncbi:Tat pathway signal protein [Luteitalea sp. TBR-22]|uniref:MBL fold metallo-hydrolase n=1 Tax=Luteitalea sp. TBR-22 TaxID=2802971 RepID=UPI001AF395FA|nr:MBL fold metallo-hydrolase [Luteitalea sp. TBR-22]BCS30968.1 Tat pathway signal protein [Luteitalea sp. TBR-22]
MPSRRTFLASGLAAGAGATAWANWSSSWSARFLRERWDEMGRAIPPAPHTPTPTGWAENAVTLAWLGHATVLINFYGLRILTDPVFFRRIGVSLGLGTLGPLRLVQCALPPAEVPDIDLLLVTHAHFDHLDRPSLAAVPGRPAVVMAHGTADLLPSRDTASVQELRWAETTRVRTPRGDAQVRAIEVRHWGARVQRDTWRGYTGFIVEREGHRLLIGGDTADTPVFRSHRAHGPFEAAVMPIGAYDPWIRHHCTPEQAIAMADAAGARRIVPVHHQSFRLSREPFLEPIERAEKMLSAEAGRLALRAIGETTVLA